jgi:hypothetical protein
MWGILFPIAVAVVTFCWALPLRDDERPTGSMFDGLSMLGPLLRSLVATIATLAAVIIWLVVL